MLKGNKAIDCDGINGDFILNVCDSIRIIFFGIWEASLEAVFHEKRKIAKVIPVAKKSHKEDVENSFYFPVFSKVLERIIYNRLYEYFMNNPPSQKSIWFSNE